MCENEAIQNKVVWLLPRVMHGFIGVILSHLSCVQGSSNLFVSEGPSVEYETILLVY